MEVVVGRPRRRRPALVIDSEAVSVQGILGRVGGDPKSVVAIGGPLGLVSHAHALRLVAQAQLHLKVIQPLLELSVPLFNLYYIRAWIAVVSDAGLASVHQRLVLDHGSGAAVLLGCPSDLQRRQELVV